MKYPIDKVFITQGFGGNPDMYAKYGMEGHNGIDFRTRFVDSPLAHRYVTPAKEGVVIEVGNQGKAGTVHSYESNTTKMNRLSTLT